MTVSESSSGHEKQAKDTVKFPSVSEEELAEARRKRAEFVKTGATVTPLANREARKPANAPVPDLSEFEKPRSKEIIRKRVRISWVAVSFLLMVIIPGIISGIYYTRIASPQYIVESQFSVRGSSSGGGFAGFGIGGLLGATAVQSNDSYIVSSYVESVQLIRDVKSEMGLDLRSFFSKPDIDFMNRIPANMPIEQFAEYWRDRVEVSFNSTTGNTTLLIYAFSPEDSKMIADAVLKVSERLVNTLSEKSRQQVTMVASSQLERAEQHLREVREQIRKLRATEKTIDPVEIAKGEATLQQALRARLTELRTRYSVLVQSVDKSAPTARAISREIKGLEDQLKMQQTVMDDAPESDGNGETGLAGLRTNVPEILNRFEELQVDHEFAIKAYMTSLGGFEAALAEAQKQERYFAVFVAPMRPEISLYPLRLMDTGISLLVLGAIWMLGQFMFRSFRDHAL